MPGLADFLKQPPRLSPRWRAVMDDHIISMAWGPNGKVVATASVAGPIHVWDTNTGNRLAELPGHGFGTTCVRFRDADTLASSGQDGKVRIWHVPESREISCVAGGAAWVEHISWSPNGDYLASAAGKKLRLFDHTGAMVREYPDHGSTISGLSWRPQGGELTSTCYGKVMIWSTANTNPVKELAWRGSVLAHAWAPNGKFLATGDQDATVHYWIYESAHHLQMSGYPTKVRELAWDPTGRWLATGGGCMVSIWDCSGAGPEGRTPIMLEAYPEQERVTAVAYQARGPLLASAGSDGRVLLWRPDKSDTPLSLAKHDAEVTQIHWSPADTKLLVGTARGEVVLYGI